MKFIRESNIISSGKEASHFYVETVYTTYEVLIPCIGIIHGIYSWIPLKEKSIKYGQPLLPI